MLTSSTRKRDEPARPDLDRGRHEMRAAEIVDRLGAPIFMDTAPGTVRAQCRGYAGIGADRSSALEALAEQIDEEVLSRYTPPGDS